MTHTIVFDTLAYAKKLKAVGVPEAQAEVQAETIIELMEERLATKLDMELVRREMKEMDVNLRRDIKEIETNLRRDMKEIETNLKRDMKEIESNLQRDMREIESNLQRDMKEMEMRLKHDLTLHLGGMMAASMAIVAALVKIL